jgi:putative endonuclease
VIRCGDDSLYIGISNDVSARFRAHGDGKGAKYTKGRGPLRLLATRRCISKSDALKLEYAMKKQSRATKKSFAQKGVLGAFARRHGFYAFVR